jgi:hypothetical protein
MTRIVWQLRLALFKRHNRLGVNLTSPEDGNRTSIRNAVFSLNLEFWAMDEAHIPSNSECYTKKKKNSVALSPRANSTD